MKLYSWITNEQRTLKTQGANRRLTIELDYEEKDKDWASNTSQHSLQIFFHLNSENEPVIIIRGNKSFLIEDKR